MLRTNGIHFVASCTKHKFKYISISQPKCSVEQTQNAFKLEIINRHQKLKQWRVWHWAKIVLITS